MDNFCEVLEKLGMDGCATITSVFDRMDIAEEEIGYAQKKYPAQADLLWNAFHLLVPPPILRDELDELYRGHCRELLDRVANAGDTRLGTHAEMLVVLKEMSLAVPLTLEAQALYFECFRACFGEQTLKELGLSDVVETCNYVNTNRAEAKGRLVSELGRKLVVESRVCDKEN